jgi:2'-5' RNA ligase
MSTSEAGRHQARERLRLFVALTLPDVTRHDLAAWQQAEVAGRRGVRPIPESQLHITLVFLGSRPAADIEPICAAIRSRTAAVRMTRIEAVGYHESRQVGMITLREGSSGGGTTPGASGLARALMHDLASLGIYRVEDRPWTPHITVARFKARPKLSPRPPQLDPFHPREVVLYESRTGPGGSIYTALESVTLPAAGNR